jgi:predicted TIM-barrel fold metal-dependent hydrolase
MITIDCHNHVGVELIHYLHGDFPYAQQLETLVREGHELGVRKWIIFPMVSHLALNLEAMRQGRIADGGMEAVPYAFENRRLLQEIYDLFPEEGRDAIPFAMFDVARNVSGQVAALRQLREQYSFFGLKTQSTITQSPITNLQGEARVFLELAQEWDIPVLIHSSVLESDVWAQARDILDVAERTPNVRFCVAHSLRFDREQLDRLAALPNAWFDCSAHRIHCDLAVQNKAIVAPPERRFDSDYTRPSRVLRDLAEAYPEKLMWGSDSPYYSFVATIEGKLFELRSTYAQEVAALRALPLHLQQQIGETNTLNFLKMNS